VAFSPHGRTLATADDGASAYLWDVTTRHLIATLTAPSGDASGSVAFSPDSRTLAAGDDAGDHAYLCPVSDQSARHRPGQGR
jgi:WD40 repeat protein